jgi:hypothetical protein
MSVIENLKRLDDIVPSSSFWEKYSAAAHSGKRNHSRVLNQTFIPDTARDR